MNRTEGSHIKQAPESGVAHFGDGRTLAHATATFIRLRIKTHKSGQPLGRALAGGEGLPAVQLHQQGQDHFAPDAGQGQQPLGVVLQVGMLLLVVSNGLLDRLQRVLQRLKDLFQIGDDRRGNARSAAHCAQTILFLLDHLLELLSALQQAVQFTHLQRQWAMGSGLLCSPKAGQQPRILTVCFCALARAMCPLPHLPRIGQANRPVLFMGKCDQGRGPSGRIAACGFDDPLHVLRTGTHLGRLDCTCQRRKPGRVIAEFAQRNALCLPHGRRRQARFGHVNANPQGVHYLVCGFAGPPILFALSGIGTGLGAGWVPTGRAFLGIYPGLSLGSPPFLLTLAHNGRVGKEALSG